MKNSLSTARLKYLFLLGVLSVGIGLISKKVISYPIDCSPINNQEMTYSSKFNRYNFS